MPRKQSVVAAAALAMVFGGLSPVLAHGDTLAAADLYVDQGSAQCSDTGPGTQAAPFCQIQAAADVVAPGQAVLINPEPGEAPYAPFKVTRSGSADAGITFASTSPAVRVRVAGTGGITSDDISVSHAQYVSLLDFSAGDQGQTAVLVSGASHITLHGGFLYGYSSTTSTAPDAVTIDGTSSDVTLSGNEFSTTNGWMIDAQSGARNIIVTNDNFNDYWGGLGGVRADGVSGIVVTADTFQLPCGSAVDISGASSGSIENVVAVEAGAYPNTPGTEFCAPFGSSAEINVDSSSAPQVHSDYNALDAYSQGVNYLWAGTSYAASGSFNAATQQGAHDVVLVPGKYYSVNNYTEGSPLIDSGDANAPAEPSTDLYGRPRVDDPKVANQGTGDGYVDRGAFEFQNPLTIIDAIPSPADGAAPLPVTETVTVNNPWNTQGVLYSTDFADGTAATAPSASLTANHTYTVPGTYKATVTATLPDGTTRSYTASRTTQVNAPGPIVPQLSDSTSSGYPSMLFLSTDSTGPWPITKTVVDFGDAKPVEQRTGNIQDLAHGYANPGSHTIRYTVTDAGGQSAVGTQQVVTGLAFVATTPQRVLDTRFGIGAAKAQVGPGGIVRVQVAGIGGIPTTGVAAVTMNVTDTHASASSYVTAYADGSPVPNASNLNFRAGQTNPNLVTVPVSSDGYVDLRNANGHVDLIADVQGYYSGWSDRAAIATQSYFSPTVPNRVLDTRSGLGAPQRPVGPGSVTTLTLPGTRPQGSTAVVLDVTETGASATSWVSVFPSMGPMPNASSLNFQPGQTTSNLVVVPIPRYGPATVRIYNNAGSVHLLADVQGYFAAGVTNSPSMLPFVPVAATRVADTRGGQPLGAGGRLRVKVTGAAGVPVGAKAVLINLTGTGPSTSTYLTAFAGGSTPNTSNIDLAPGETRPILAVVPVDDQGYITVQNAHGTVNVFADLEGYYA
ncbi:hypothetical protein ABIA33_003652 [Streptacidiphilus sp. MAP12-16]|uniref:PKD domain-containing protein n=1 Tax=Streptacidiphilus sp. MAP12-16 TaxID=3156300 RepID=UPI003518374D